MQFAEWTTWRWMAACGALALAAAQAAALERPSWMDDNGFVLAESWRSPAHRARALGRMDLLLPASEQEGFRREHSPEMMAELKALGVTAVLTHYYEGFGPKTEEAGMKDARTLAAMARKAGLHVGAYIGGTLGWESLVKECPDAGAWQAATPDGQPVLDDPSEPFRRVAAFLRPACHAHWESVLRRAVTEMGADMIYFDHVGLGNDSWDRFTAAQFRDFLTARGFENTIRVKTPPAAGARDELGKAWVDFRIQSTAERFRKLSRFVSSLNPQCAVICNPGGVDNDSAALRGVDHPQLLAFSHAFRGEATKPGWNGQHAVTRIRSLKAGQAFGNATLLECESPLELAESMAFNLHSLGSIAWFENGVVVPPRERNGRVSPFLKPYLDFHRAHMEFYRNVTRATDVAVLRTRETFAHGDDAKRRAVSDSEQALIESQTPFAILFDANWDSLDAHQAVVTTDESGLSAAQRKRLDEFKARGGELVPATTFLGDPQRARERLREQLRVQVAAPPAVAVEVTERRMASEVLVHLVNYRIEQPVKDISVTVRAGRLSRPLQAEYWNPLSAKPISLKLTRAGNQLQLTVPHLDIYGLVVISGAML